MGFTEQAFRDFYESTARPLWGYLSRACSDPSLADDLLQESYLRFLSAENIPKDPEHCRHYLFRIASNLLVDHFRQSRRIQTGLTDALSDTGSDRREISSSDFYKFFNQLSPGERRLLWLAYVEGFSHREIGNVLSLKENSVRPLLFRARNKIAGLLRRHGLIPPRR